MGMREKWNSRYKGSDALPTAARVLAENLHLLPASGKALDVACGLGGNAIALAQQGLQVDACDIADVAITRLQEQASNLNLGIHAEARDIELNPPPASHYDVVVVSYFLSRPLIPLLIAALKPGGLIYYQTFIQSKVSDRGPANPEFRLADQELLGLMMDCQVLVYREEGCVGNVNEGFRDEAMYIGMKPSPA